MFYFFQFLAPVFLYQKNGARNPVHTASFLSQETYDRNLRQKLASLNSSVVTKAVYPEAEAPGFETEAVASEDGTDLKIVTRLIGAPMRWKICKI